MPHAIVSWSTSSAALESQLQACLQGRSWVRPVPGLQIVVFHDEDDRYLFVERVKAIARANRGQVQVLVGPLQEGGHYSGWLRRDLWEAIARRTE